MAKDLADRYSRTLRSLIVSNAAFVDPDVRVARSRSGRTELVIGLLSNLTADKGLHEFIAVLRLAVQRGLLVKGVLAGAGRSRSRQTSARDRAERIGRQP